MPEDRSITHAEMVILGSWAHEQSALLRFDNYDGINVVIEVYSHVKLFDVCSLMAKLPRWECCLSEGLLGKPGLWIELRKLPTVVHLSPP